MASLRMWLRACVAAGLGLVPVSLAAQDSAEVALVKHVFAQLQPVSFAENREFCGYIGYGPDGALRATAATRGDLSSCLADDPGDMDIIASYHTHGGFDPDHFNEIPSGTDMEGDEEEGIDGWVATPGGRLWYVDSEAMVTSQICGLGCLPQDPAFRAGQDGRIALSYGYDELVEKLDE